MELNFTDTGAKTVADYGELIISGDETKGFRPFQLMVASIASCSGFVLKQILEKQRIEIDSLSVQTSVERNEADANKIEKITLHYIIKGTDLDRDRMDKNLALSRKNCSMVRSVETSIKIIETIEITE